MYIGTFNDFIFESQFGQDRLDFCLDLFTKYRNEGKGMQDLPRDIQMCIKSGGQTDFDSGTNELYLKYLENEKSFDLIRDLDYNQIGSTSESKVEHLANVLKQYGKSIQYSIVEEGNGQYQLVIAGREVTINMIFDQLSRVMSDQELTYPNGEEYYSEIMIFLTIEEVEELSSFLD